MIRRLLRWSLYAIGLVLLLVVGAGVFLQTAPGKRLLADQLSSRLSTPEAGFEIAGIDGWLPLDMQINTFQLSDPDGVWLKADGVTLDWSPSALFGGRIQVDEIAADRIEVLRPPLADDTPEPPSDEPFRLPELPTSLPPITVERLAIPEILLGAPLLGEAASFSLEGAVRANDSGDQVEAALDLRRTDEKTAFASLDATAGLNPPVLDLALNAGESGGMIGALLDRPDMGEVTLSLNGKGPLDDWSGRLEADAGGLALAQADVGLALVEQPRITLNALLRPAGELLPEDIAPLIGDALSLDLDVVQTKAQALDLKKVAIVTDLATVDGGGSVDFDRGDLDLQTRLAIPDLTPLGALAKAELSGGAEATLDLAGTITAPKGTLQLDVAKPAFDGNAAEKITTTIDLLPTAPLDADQPAFYVTIEGGADGLAIPDAVLPDPDVAWNAKLAVPLEGEIGIDDVTIETAGSSLSASGGIDPATLDGTIDLALNTPSIKRLAEPYGQPVDGKALVKAAIRLADQAKSIAVDLDATLDDLANLPPGAGELLGKQATVQAKAGLDPSQVLTLESLAVNGAHIGLDGSADLNLEQKGIAGRFDLALPDLTALGALAPDGTEGAIDLQADLGGNLDAPTADLVIQSRDLVLAGEPIAALKVALAGTDLIASPNGDLQIDLTARETPTTLSLGYRLQGDRLDLDAIDLKAPETEIKGALAILLDQTLIDGSLEGRIADLGALTPLIQQQLGGSIDLSANLKPEGASQSAEVTVQGNSLQGDFGRLKTLNAEATITDALKAPSTNAKATLTGFEQGSNKVDALTLTASGDADAVDLDFSMAGEIIKTLELTGKARAGFEDGVTLGIERLEGAFAGEPLRLQSPLAFRQAGDDITLSDLDLRLGAASLTGDVAINEREVLGEIDLRSLPLTWSEIFGGPVMTGDVNAAIDLGGSPADPSVVTTLNVDGALIDGVAAGDLPLTIALNTSLDQGRLTADLEGSGLTRKPITASASLPAKLALRPFAFDMPEDGALEGRIDAELLLARLGDLLALDDQTLKGTLTADITLGGTLGAPEVEGPVRIEGGAYENGTTGTDLLDINLNAVASSQRFEVVGLAARTGKKRGNLSANGWLDLDAGADFPLSFTLKLDDARLVNRDDADARISGEIAMTGNLADAIVKGDLFVNRAEISIPDGGGPNLPELEVTEIGGRIVNPEEEEEETGAEKPFDPTLDMRIKLPNKIFVRGRGLESEWLGDLEISGRASAPVIVGDLSVKKGFFDFLDKRFDLARGEIVFSGSTPPNPILAIEARAEDDDFTAIIKLNGPADDPELVLSSEPVLPDDEVLARLLFNRQLSEIGPVEAGKLALAANKLRGGGGGFDAFGEIRNVLRIDTLDVVSDEDGETAVKAGKYLDDDVYVEVEKGAGDESGRARVEIEVLPNIAIEAETSENADTGVGVKWKLDY